MSIVTYANLYAEYLECKQDVDLAIARCISNSSFINGPEVSAFEKKWAEYTNSESCAGVNSGTSAIMLALLAIGVKPSDEVIVPAMSFISTAECVSQIGANPVFCDIDQYHTINLDQLPKLINNQTRAIIFVDLYGQTIDIDRLKQIANGIPLIEDAAQSSVCKYQGDPIGNLVDATCFSFYPGKNLAAFGDAGAVTGSTKIVDQVKMLKNHGRREKYVHEILGWNERLDGIHAAVLSAKLPYLDKWINQRQTNANIYFNELQNVPVELPKLNHKSNHVFNQFVIKTEDRQQLRDYLHDHSIETGVQYPLAMHQQPVYNRNESLPMAEDLAAKCLSLPVHAYCTSKDIQYVCDVIKNYFN